MPDQQFNNFIKPVNPTKPEEEINQLPDDFPKYQAPDQDQYKISRAGMPENDKRMFFDNKGQLDEEMTTRLWYGITKAAQMNNVNIPTEDPRIIEIASIGALKGIPFKECIEKSGAYTSMASLPEGDAERQKLLDFQANIISRSFTKNLRENIASVPELSAIINRFLTAKIQNEANLSRKTMLKDQGNDDDLTKKLREEYLAAYKELEDAVKKNNLN